LNQVKADELGTAQSRGEQHMHDCTVPQRTGVPMDGGPDLLALVTAALESVEGVEAVQDVFHRAHLRLAQRPRVGGGQPQQLHTLGRVAVGQQRGRGVRDGPGEQRRQVRKMIVHRGRRHHLRPAVGQRAHHGGREVLPPQCDLAGGHRGDPVVPESFTEPITEPHQVSGDLAGDLRRADPLHRCGQVRLGPEAERLGPHGGHPEDRQHLS
jgi:hypothetical protein